MLDSIRRHSRSIFVYILFGFLIAAFVLSFGRGAGTGGCLPKTFGSSYAVYVLGSEVSEQELAFWAHWHAVNHLKITNTQESQLPAELLVQRQHILDALIRRELLIAEAKKWGLVVSEDEVNERVQNAEMRFDGRVISLKQDVAPSGYLDYEKLKNYLLYHGLSVRQFIDIQTHELWADKARKWIRLHSQVSEEDIRKAYEDEQLLVNLAYVSFSRSSAPRSVLDPTQAQLDAFSKAHVEDVKKMFEQRKSSYENQGPAVHWKRILVRWKPSSEPQKPQTPASKGQNKEQEEKQVAQAKMDKASMRIKKGERFEVVAWDMSEDDISNKKGGDKGWQPKNQLFFDEGTRAKVFSARPGDVVGPVLSSEGFELIKVVGFVEGNISFEQAQVELAEEMYRRENAAAWAKEKAQDLFVKLKQGKKITDVYPVEIDEKAGVLFHTQETGLVKRTGSSIPGIGNKPELARAMFVGSIGDVLGPVDDRLDWIVATIQDRKQPDWNGFAAQQDELRARLENAKAVVSSEKWVQQQCLDAKALGKIKVHPNALGGDGSAAGVAKTLYALAKQSKYEPCSSLPNAMSGINQGMSISVPTTAE